MVTSQPLSNSLATSISWEPRFPPTERIDGEPGTRRAFIAQCSLIIELQPSSFPSDHSKIVYLITMMSRRALVWATAVWEQQSAVCFSLEEFVVEVKKVFDAPLPGREAARKLLQLQKDYRSVADYSMDFHTLAAESAWNQEALFDMFLHCVSEEVKDELAAREQPTDLYSLIALTIRIDR
jgi:hypothetical protein